MIICGGLDTAAAPSTGIAAPTGGAAGVDAAVLHERAQHHMNPPPATRRQ